MPGRQDSGGGNGEPSERGPHEVLAARHPGERAPQGDVPAEGALRVEEREVRALLRRLDEAGAEAGLAKDRVEVLRREIAREVDLAGSQPGADRRRAHSGPELDPVEARRLLPVVRVALEDDAVGRPARDDERTRADRGLAAVRRRGATRTTAVRTSDRRAGKIGSGSTKSNSSRSSEIARIPETSGGRAFPVLGGAPNRRERGRHPVGPHADRPLERQPSRPRP